MASDDRIEKKPAPADPIWEFALALASAPPVAELPFSLTSEAADQKAAQLGLFRPEIISAGAQESVDRVGPGASIFI